MAHDQDGHPGATALAEAGAVRHAPLSVIDVHVHLGPFRNFHIPQNDAHGVVAAMNSMGIDVSVVSAHAGISSDFVLGNDLVIDAAQQYPGRVLGYCVVNPNYPGDMREELERCFEYEFFRGIKVHPELHDDHALDSGAYRAMWEFAAERRVPVLSHSFYGGDGLAVFGRMAAEYSEVPVLLGHAGQDFGLEKVATAVRRHDNLWLDLSGLLSTEGAVESLVAELGADRIMFGSDLPFIAGALQLGTLLYSRLDGAEVSAIAGGNAARLFGVRA